MRVVPLLLLLLFPVGALAGDVTLTWSAPTLNEDSTPYTDPAGYKLYYGTAQGGAYPIGLDIPDPSVLTTTVSNLVDDTYYFVATAYNTSGVESAYSNEATKIVASIPSPPSNVTVIDMTVYYVIQQPGSFILLPVGTIPTGVGCDETQYVNGLFSVPVDQVTWTGTVRPLVVVADCG